MDVLELGTTLTTHAERDRPSVMKEKLVYAALNRHVF